MRFALTSGQASDGPQAIPLLTSIGASAVLADKGIWERQDIGIHPGRWSDGGYTAQKQH